VFYAWSSLGAGGKAIAGMSSMCTTAPVMPTIRTLRSQQSLPSAGPCHSSKAQLCARCSSLKGRGDPPCLLLSHQLQTTDCHSAAGTRGRSCHRSRLPRPRPRPPAPSTRVSAAGTPPQGCREGTRLLGSPRCARTPRLRPPIVAAGGWPAPWPDRHTWLRATRCGGAGGVAGPGEGRATRSM